MTNQYRQLSTGRGRFTSLATKRYATYAPQSKELKAICVETPFFADGKAISSMLADLSETDGRGSFFTLLGEIPQFADEKVA